MYTESFHADSIAWAPTGLEGVEFKTIDGDLANSAAVAIYRFAPGCVVVPHLHSVTDEVAYILDGDFIEDGVTHHAGSVFKAPAGTVHGEHRTKTGCTVMFVFSRELDFVAA